jgi:hypothetical protein
MVSTIYTVFRTTRQGIDWCCPVGGYTDREALRRDYPTFDKDNFIFDHNEKRFFVQEVPNCDAPYLNFTLDEGTRVGL